MRKCRVIENCRCYHLISRLAHQAFFLDAGEKTRAVELLRRVEEFCGVTVLAYAIMTNHFHIYVYVPEPEEIDDDEILRRINVLYRDASLSQVLGQWTRLKSEEKKMLEHGRGAHTRVAWGRPDEAFGDSQGDRHSQQHSFQSVLPCAATFERHDCAKGSEASEVPAAEVQFDMIYSINATMYISSDPLSPPADGGVLILDHDNSNFTGKWYLTGPTITTYPARVIPSLGRCSTLYLNSPKNDICKSKRYSMLRLLLQNASQ